MKSTHLRAILYIAGTCIQKAGMFLFIPLIAFALSREDISRYGLYTSAMALFVPFVTQNVQLAGERLSFDYPADSPLRRSLNLTVLLGAFVTSAMISGLVALAPLIAARFHVSAGFAEHSVSSLTLFGLITVTMAVSQASQTVMRVNGDAMGFAASSAVRVLLAIVIFGLAVLIGRAIGFSPSLDMLLLSLVAGGVASCLVAFAYTRDDYHGGTWNWQIYKQAWLYSAPTAIHVVIGALNATGGRWVGEIFLGLDALAEYSILSMIVVGVSAVARSCIEACRPVFMRAFAAGDFVTADMEVRRATLLAVGSVLAGYTAIVSLLWLCFDFRLGGITFSLPLLLLACAANMLDAAYLYGIGVLLGLKRSRDPAIASAAMCIVSLSVTFVACVIHPSSTSLLAAQVVTYTCQSIVFILWAQVQLARQQEQIPLCPIPNATSA